MRLAWLGLTLALGCATGEGVDDSNAGGVGNVGGGGTPSGGAAGGGAAGGGAAGLGGGPTGGAAGGGGAGGGTGGVGGSGGSGGSSSGGSGGAPACSIQGCQDGPSSGSGCPQARVIGRVSAASAAGYVKTDTTCSATDQSTGYGSGCADSGRDHTYRIFLRAGENIAVTLSQGAKCASAASWNRTFKIYSGSGCADTTCANKTFCYSPGAGSYNKGLNVTQDGWYFLVVDGSAGQGSGDDSGSYTLTVKLSCKTAGCEC